MLESQVVRKRRVHEVCHCKAYPFPHRLGSGKCWGNDSGPFCGCCGKPCSPRRVDNGIGAYEYWGCKGVHTQIDIESDCCDASVYSNPELTVNFDGDSD